jgi:hypothetical protein
MTTQWIYNNKWIVCFNAIKKIEYTVILCSLFGFVLCTKVWQFSLDFGLLILRDILTCNIYIYIYIYMYIVSQSACVLSFVYYCSISRTIQNEQYSTCVPPRRLSKQACNLYLFSFGLVRVMALRIESLAYDHTMTHQPNFSRTSVVELP